MSCLLLRRMTKCHGFLFALSTHDLVKPRFPLRYKTWFKICLVVSKISPALKIYCEEYLGLKLPFELQNTFQSTSESRLHYKIYIL